MKILYNSINASRRRFLYNLLDPIHDVTIMNADGMKLKELNSFDLIINERHTSRVVANTNLNAIQPSKIINGGRVSTKKTYVGELFTKYFKVPLNIYYGDESYNGKGKIFVKEEGQTTGRYWVKDKPVWKKGLVNQINYANEKGIYGIYFCCGKLIYSYNYRSGTAVTKFKNAKKKEYYSNDDTYKLFGDYAERLIAMATEAGLDYGRFDVIMDDKVGLVAIDLNNAPFGNQVFEHDFMGTGIMQEAVALVNNLIKEQY